MKMETKHVPIFDALAFRPTGISNRATVFYSNGYGASIVIGEYTYAGREGLYKIAVLKGDAEQNVLTYETPITSDVIGHLSKQEVAETLVKIQALPKATG